MEHSHCSVCSTVTLLWLVVFVSVFFLFVLVCCSPWWHLFVMYEKVYLLGGIMLAVTCGILIQATWKVVSVLHQKIGSRYRYTLTPSVVQHTVASREVCRRPFGRSVAESWTRLLAVFQLALLRFAQMVPNLRTCWILRSALLCLLFNFCLFTPPSCRIGLGCF